MLDAAYAILTEKGLRSFSVEAVAARSKVARTTIYRSWPTKGLLAFDSLREAFETSLAFDPSVAPEHDVRALIRSLAQKLSGPAGRLAASVIAEAQNDASLKGQFLEHFSVPLRRRSEALLKAGVQSGRFRADLDVSSVADAAVGAIYLRLLLGLSLDDAWADTLALTLVRGCVSNVEEKDQTRISSCQHAAAVRNPNRE